MKTLAIIILIITAISISSIAHSATIVGGYDLDKITIATIEHLKKAGLIAPDDQIAANIVETATKRDPMVVGGDYTALYDRLGMILIERKVVVAAEIDEIQAVARANGGLKVAGMNPLVLAASYLDLLARKNILTLSQAQEILDSSKVMQLKGQSSKGYPTKCKG